MHAPTAPFRCWTGKHSKFANKLSIIPELEKLDRVTYETRMQQQQWHQQRRKSWQKTKGDECPQRWQRHNPVDRYWILNQQDAKMRKKGRRVGTSFWQHPGNLKVIGAIKVLGWDGCVSHCKRSRQQLLHNQSSRNSRWGTTSIACRKLEGGGRWQQAIYQRNAQ